MQAGIGLLVHDLADQRFPGPGGHVRTPGRRGLPGGPGGVVGHPGLAERVRADQADDPELVRVREAGLVHRLQPVLHERQRVRGHRRRGHRHLGDPRVLVDRLPLDHGPHPQPVPPVVPAEHEVLGPLGAGVPHQLEEFLLAGDVPVQRHRGEPELLGDARHRDRLERPRRRPAGWRPRRSRRRTGPASGRAGPGRGGPRAGPGPGGSGGTTHWERPAGVSTRRPSRAS